MSVQLTKNEIFSIIQQHKVELSHLGVMKIGLFGSYVRQQERVDSDIDLLIELETGKRTFKGFMKTANFLETLMGRQTDVVTWNSLPEFVKKTVQSEIEYVSFNH